jgi:hypothetical protein
VRPAQCTSAISQFFVCQQTHNGLWRWWIYSRPWPTPWNVDCFQLGCHLDGPNWALIQNNLTMAELNEKIERLMIFVWCGGPNATEFCLQPGPPTFTLTLQCCTERCSGLESRTIFGLACASWEQLVQKISRGILVTSGRFRFL